MPKGSHSDSPGGAGQGRVRVAAGFAAGLLAAACGGEPAPVLIDLLAEPTRLHELATEDRARAYAWSFDGEEPTRWSLRVHRGRAHGGVVASGARGGRGGLCLEAGDRGADADARVHVPIQPSARYRLEGYVRTHALEPRDGSVHGTFYLGEFSYSRSDGRDGNDPVQWHRDLPAQRGTSEGWVPIRYEFETAPDARMLRIGASLANWGTATGRVCFDDVRLVDLGGLPEPAGAAVAHVAAGGELRRALRSRVPAEHRYRLQVPAGARLRLATGLRAVGDGGGRLRFQVRVAAAGATHTLYSRSRAVGRDEGWEEVDLSLEAYAGREVELALRTDPDHLGDGTPAGAVAYWANPAVWVPGAARDRAAEPDVILISVDTLRADHLGCYGYDRPTSPAVDRLAAEGVLFENAFTPVPRTTPALASLMTGEYPREHGLRTLLHALPPESATLAEHMKSRGYVTAAFVSPNVPRHSGLTQGFDVFNDQIESRAGSRAETLAGQAARWVRSHAGMKLFLWLHLWDPHFRYDPPPPWDRAFDPDYEGEFELYSRLDARRLRLGEVYFRNDLDARDVRHAVALYDGEVAYADAVIGRFLDRLRAAGLYDRSLIAFTADHGESLGEHDYFFEHGAYLYDVTLRIPLILKLPSAARAGLRVRGQTMIQDLFPTILAAVGSAAPSGVAGRDLAGFLSPDAEPHPVCFHETGRRFFAENPRRPVDGIAGNWTAARAGGWKLIRIPGLGAESFELYSLGPDPWEARNLFDARPERAGPLGSRLERWLASSPDDRPEDEPRLDEPARQRMRALGYAD